jgi:hypothetical protein
MDEVYVSNPSLASLYGLGDCPLFFPFHVKYRAKYVVYHIFLNVHHIKVVP